MIINDTADFIGMNHQLVCVSYADGDDITCKKLKECLAILLQYSPYCEKDFTIRTADGIHKKDGRRYFGCAPAYFEFYDADGNECSCHDVILNVFVLHDEDKIVLIPNPHLRYFSCAIGEKLRS